MRSIDEFLLDDHLSDLRDRLASAGVEVAPQTAIDVRRHAFDWRIRARAHASMANGLGCVGRITLDLPHRYVAAWCPRAPAFLAGLLLHEVAHLERDARCSLLARADHAALHGTAWRRALESVVNASGWVLDTVAVPRSVPPADVDNWLAELPWTADALCHARWILEDPWRPHA